MSTPTWDVLLPPEIDSAGPNAIRDIATFTTRDTYDTTTALRADIDRYDAIITRTHELSADLIAAADNLKLIAKHGAGMDNIDIEAATANNVLVANTPGANKNAVAEHAATLLLAVKRNVVQADTATRDADWRRHDFQGRELANRTLGLFGAGNAGQRLAELLTGFDISCVAYDPYVDPATLPSNVALVNSTTALVDQADDLSVHAPFTPETEHAISDAELTALPDDAVVVNTARGGIIDEAALVDALAANDIAGAGIDVYETEPPAADDPLLSRDDVVLTQHTAGVTTEALREMSRRGAANVRTVYTGNIPETTVNASEVTLDYTPPSSPP